MYLPIDFSHFGYILHLLEISVTICSSSLMMCVKINEYWILKASLIKIYSIIVLSIDVDFYVDFFISFPHRNAIRKDFLVGVSRLKIFMGIRQLKSSIFVRNTTQTAERRCEIIPTGLIDVILFVIFLFSPFSGIFLFSNFEKVRDQVVKGRNKNQKNEKIM